LCRVGWRQRLDDVGLPLVDLSRYVDQGRDGARRGRLGLLRMVAQVPHLRQQRKARAFHASRQIDALKSLPANAGVTCQYSNGISRTGSLAHTYHWATDERDLHRLVATTKCDRTLLQVVNLAIGYKDLVDGIQHAISNQYEVIRSLFVVAG